MIFNKKLSNLNKSKSITVFLVMLLAGLLLSGCQSPNNINQAQPQKLTVLATTTIVADIVNNIGGDAIHLDVLLPAGIDPHSFDPTPSDSTKIEQANIIFANGAGLESSIKNILDNALPGTVVIYLSDDLALMPSVHGHEYDVFDPHTFFDPLLVSQWVDKITVALIELDSENATVYQVNAKAYHKKLLDLDDWIKEETSAIPPEKRKLVTDHYALTYFAERYGFEQVGALIPSTSTLAEPSAKELAGLVDLIQDQGINSIFMNHNSNLTIADQISKERKIMLVKIYTGSLSPSDGPASDYIAFMKHNVSQIVMALSR